MSIQPRYTASDPCVNIYLEMWLTWLVPQDIDHSGRDRAEQEEVHENQLDAERSVDARLKRLRQRQDPSLVQCVVETDEADGCAEQPHCKCGRQGSRRPSEKHDIPSSQEGSRGSRITTGLLLIAPSSPNRAQLTKVVSPTII